MSAPAASSRKRKSRSGSGNGTAAAADPASSSLGSVTANLKQWMEDVINAPPAPEDAPMDDEGEVGGPELEVGEDDDEIEDPTMLHTVQSRQDEEETEEKERSDAVAGDATAPAKDTTASAAVPAPSSTPTESAAAGAIPSAAPAAAPASPPTQFPAPLAAIPRSHFRSLRDLFVALQQSPSNKSDALYASLVRFHRQIREESVSPPPSLTGDTLLSLYWTTSPDAKEIFAILDSISQIGAGEREGAHKMQTKIMAKVYELFSRMIMPSMRGSSLQRSFDLIRRVLRNSKYFNDGLLRILKLGDQRMVQAGLVFLLNMVICCGTSPRGMIAGPGPSPGATGTGTSSGMQLLREFVMKFPWGSKFFIEIAYKPFQASSLGHAKLSAAVSAMGKGSGGGRVDATKTVGESATNLLSALLKSRHLFMQLIVELLSRHDAELTLHLLSIKGFITSVLKHLRWEPPQALGLVDALLHAFVKHILEVKGIPNSVKFGFFNSYVLEQMLELFKGRSGRTAGASIAAAAGSEGTSGTAHTPSPAATIAALAASLPGHGHGGRVVRVSQRKAAQEQVELIERTVREFIAYLSKHAVTTTTTTGGGASKDPQAATLRQFGPLILRIVSSLHANESLLEQQLYLDILRSFPPVILAEALAKFSYTFEPRVSFRWVNHVALVAKIWNIKWERKLVMALTDPSANGKQQNVGDELVLLHPHIPLVPGRSHLSGSSSSSSGGSSGPPPFLFSFLLPSSIHHRLTLSQCVQHPSALVRYSTLNLIRCMLTRYGELVAEYRRQWLKNAGVSLNDNASTSSTTVTTLPPGLTSSLASIRSHLIKILPDIQVLFGLRSKIMPKDGAAASMEEMKKELETFMAANAGTKSEEDKKDEADAPAKKKQKKKTVAKDTAPVSAISNADAPSDPASALSLSFRSRHIQYSRFLSVLAGMTEHAPEIIVEGRIDVFKLLPSINNPTATVSNNPPLSWWSLSELLNIFHWSQAWKHGRLFTLVKHTASASATSSAVHNGMEAPTPTSYFGHLLQLYANMLEEEAQPGSSSMIEEGHEQPILLEQEEKEARAIKEDPAAPRLVCERMRDFLTQILMHTGLFTASTTSSTVAGPSASSSSSAAATAAYEEVHLWLSSLRTAADRRFFEVLIASMVSSQSAWMKMEEEDEAAAAAAAASTVSDANSDMADGSRQDHAKFKPSPLLFATFAPSFQSTLAQHLSPSPSSVLLPSVFHMIRNVMCGMIRSPCWSTQTIERHLARVVCRRVSQSGLTVDEDSESKQLLLQLKSMALLKQFVQASSREPVSGSWTKASTARSSITKVEDALQLFQAAVPSPHDTTALAVLVSSFRASNSQLLLVGEGSKLVLLSHARSTLLRLLSHPFQSPSLYTTINGIWNIIQSIVRSGDFESISCPPSAPFLTPTTSSDTADTQQTKLPMPLPMPMHLVATRLEVLFAPSDDGMLIDHFHPSSTSTSEALLSHLLGFFVLDLLASAAASKKSSDSALTDVTRPILQRIMYEAIELAGSDASSSTVGGVAGDEENELPLVLHLLQRSFPFFTAGELTALAQAFCVAPKSTTSATDEKPERKKSRKSDAVSISSVGVSWVERIAAAGGESAGLARQLLQHGGSQSVHMLSDLIIRTSKGGSAHITGKRFVLEHLLLQLLEDGLKANINGKGPALLPQLQPSFFTHCLESMYTVSAANDGTASGERSGAELYGQFVAMFLGSEVSALYVPIFLQHFLDRFRTVIEPEDVAVFSDESVKDGLIRSLPALVAILSSSHIHIAGDAGKRVARFACSRAIQSVFLPYFLEHQSLPSHLSVKGSEVIQAEIVRSLHVIVELVRLACSSVDLAPFFPLALRTQLLQFAVTGQCPPIIDEGAGQDQSMDVERESKDTKKKKSKKKKSKSKKKKKKSKRDDSSSSSSSDSSSDEEDASMNDDDASASITVTPATSSYEFIEPTRFDLVRTILTSFPSMQSNDEASDVETPPPSLNVQISLSQSYAHFLTQAFASLNRSLKYRLKAREKAAAAAQAGETMPQPKPDARIWPDDAEAKLIATLTELLSASVDSSLASGPDASAVAVKSILMLPLSSLLRLVPNPTLNAALLTAYAKLFPSTLRAGYVDTKMVSFVRAAFLWQLHGMFSRNLFVHRIFGGGVSGGRGSGPSNYAFTNIVGVDEKGEEIEEPEVPSLLSVCALAASPDAEAFVPLSTVADAVGESAEEGSKIISSVPTAQSLFELVVSHSRFVTVVAPGAVASDSDDDEPGASPAAVRLQLEYLRLLLLLFSFPDASPPCDWSLQQNLWLLLLATYHATTSPTDSAIKLLLDLFEDIACGEKVVKRHKKMDYEHIVSHRRWGPAGVQLLSSRMNDGASGSGGVGGTISLTELDPTAWIYTNFEAGLLAKGPMLSRAQAKMAAEEGQDQTNVSSGGGEEKNSGTTTPNDASASVINSGNDVRYDPTFVLPFLHHFFTSYAPDARKCMDSQFLAFVLQSMSHPSVRIRRMAYACMGKFQAAMELMNVEAQKEKEKKEQEEKEGSSHDVDADGDTSMGGNNTKSTSKEKTSKVWEAKKAAYHESRGLKSVSDGAPVYAFREFPQINLLLSVLKNGITRKYQPLPCIITTFLSRALPILLRPDHALYRSINRFLLARPLLDLADIPMFYAYFHSGSTEHGRMQRHFILRCIKDGMATEGAMEYELLRRRHAAELLCAYIANKQLSDRVGRQLSIGILEAAVRTSPHFLAELVRVHAFHSWVASQIRSGLNHGNQWGTIRPILKLTLHTVQAIDEKMPNQPEADLDVNTTEQDGIDEIDVEDGEANAVDMVEGDVDGEGGQEVDVAMHDVDGEELIAESSQQPSNGQRRSKSNPAQRAPLSPQAEALKALRKRQRQRAQVARELSLLMECLTDKFHEFCWREHMVAVAAPTIPVKDPPQGTYAAANVSTQHAVVETVLALLAQMLSTCRKAHVASKRLTNRIQLLNEGLVSAESDSSASPPAAAVTTDAFAPIALRPIFLHALVTVPQTFTAAPLSSAALQHLHQILLLSSPTPVIPAALPSSTVNQLLCPVRDTDADVIHHFQALTWLAQRTVAEVSSAAASSASFSSSSSSTSLAALLNWLDVLLQSHPQLLRHWWTPQPHANLGHALLACYRILANTKQESSTSAQYQLVKLNGIFARILGADAKDERRMIMSNALEATTSLSSPQRDAFKAAWEVASTEVIPHLLSHISSASSIVLSHSHPLSTTMPSSSFMWLNGFTSLLLEELFLLVLTWSQHRTTVVKPGPMSEKEQSVHETSIQHTRQSAAFILIRTAASNADSDEESESDNHSSRLQRSVLNTLQPHVSSLSDA